MMSMPDAEAARAETGTMADRQVRLRDGRRAAVAQTAQVLDREVAGGIAAASRVTGMPLATYWLAPTSVPNGIS